MKQREEMLPSQDLVDLVQTMQLAAMAEIDADGQIDGDQVRSVFRILGRQIALHILSVSLLTAWSNTGADVLACM